VLPLSAGHAQWHNRVDEYSLDHRLIDKLKDENVGKKMSRRARVLAKKVDPLCHLCEPLGARVPLRKIPTVMESTRSTILILGQILLYTRDDDLAVNLSVNGAREG
jgi:hypothetical protein